MLDPSAKGALMLVTDDLDDATIERAGALVLASMPLAASYGRSCPLPSIVTASARPRCSSCATAAIAAWS